MKFNDQGIIINIRNHGESSAIVKILCHKHGIFRGFVKYAKSKKNRTIFQVGNLVSFEFFSRIEENLGSFLNVDLVENYHSRFLFNKIGVDCSYSLFSIIDDFFLERENLDLLFDKLQIFLENLSKDHFETKNIIAEYIKLELLILKSLGYEIDISSCVATNSKIDLVFVSPKSARAVCYSAGKPYENKLLKLPQFLLDDNNSFDNNHLLDGLEMSGFFLEKFLFSEKNFGNLENFSRNEEKLKRRNNIKKLLKDYA